MGKHLLNILEGARQALTIWPNGDYIHPSKDGFRRDVIKLRGDSARVGQGLRKTIKKHGKQTHDREGQS